MSQRIASFCDWYSLLEYNLFIQLFKTVSYFLFVIFISGWYLLKNIILSGL